MKLGDFDQLFLENPDYLAENEDYSQILNSIYSFSDRAQESSDSEGSMAHYGSARLKKGLPGHDQSRYPFGETVRL